MSKSVLDAGWSKYRTMLNYKSDSAGVWFGEINESYSTQECSSCHARTGPKGRAELNVRSWTCSCCNTSHDRDINAAINIRERGLREMELSFSITEEAQTWGFAKAIEAVVNKQVHFPLSEVVTTSGVGPDPLVAGILAL